MRQTETDQRDTVRVLLAHAHGLIHFGIGAALRASRRPPAAEIVAATTRGAALLPLVRRHRPDVVLLGRRLADGDGLAWLDRLATTSIVVLDADDPEAVVAADAGGAAGCVVLTAEAREVAEAVRLAATGSPVGVLRGGAREGDHPALTRGELRMLRLVADGLTNRAIAATLAVSQATVKFHLNHVYRKLDLDNRTQAVRYAYESGLVERGSLRRG